MHIKHRQRFGWGVYIIPVSVVRVFGWEVSIPVSVVRGVWLGSLYYTCICSPGVSPCAAYSASIVPRSMVVSPRSTSLSTSRLNLNNQPINHNCYIWDNLKINQHQKLFSSRTDKKPRRQLSGLYGSIKRRRSLQKRRQRETLFYRFSARE